MSLWASKIMEFDSGDNRVPGYDTIIIFLVTLYEGGGFITCVTYIVFMRKEIMCVEWFFSLSVYFHLLAVTIPRCHIAVWDKIALMIKRRSCRLNINRNIRTTTTHKYEDDGDDEEEDMVEMRLG